MATSEHFAALLSTLAREITRRQASEVCCGELTLEQFRTLRAVAAAARSTIGSLSAGMHVDLSTMSRNVALLEKNGHLRRARAENDGRIVEVTLTAKGRRALDTLRCGERDVLGDLYDRLAPADRPRVVRALETLNECLQGAQGVQATKGAEACCPPARLGRAAS